MARAKKKLAAPPKPAQGKQMVLPASGKLPGAGNSHERVCWRFTHADRESKWGFQALDLQAWNWIAEKLPSFERMTVQELRQCPLYTEYELPSKLLQEALDRLEPMRLGDMTRIGRLRFQGACRLYGFLEANVFHVIWWDPRHEIWPLEKSHT